MPQPGSSKSSSEMKNMATSRGKKTGLNCCCRHPVACGTVLLILAGLSLATIGVMIGVRPAIHTAFTKTVDQQVQLTPGTEGTSQFKSSSAPLYTKFYFFNVTNPTEVQEHGAHPIVTQLGPYTYREYRTKYNLKWQGNQTQVNYDLNITYVFEPNMSSGDPKKDHIITLNLPLYVILTKIEEIEKKYPGFLQDVIKELLHLIEEVTSENGLFMNTSVDALLFGYNDTLLLKVKELVEKLPIIDHLIQINPFFGLENRTEVQPNNTVYTGKDNIDKVGTFIQWSGHPEIYENGGWGTAQAKMINGTGGFMFHPSVSQHENLTAFISELYRSGYFSFYQETSLYNVKLHEFRLPAAELKSANQDPGFYPNGPDGVLNLTAVFEESAPVFASKPHFLDAFHGYRDNVTGMNPDRALHDSYLGVEPITGAVMEAAKRIQINLLMKEYHYLKNIEYMMPDLMMPIFWASEEGQLTSSLATQFKRKVYGAKYGIEAAVWASVGIGGLVLIFSSICFVGLTVGTYRKRYSKRKTLNIEPNEHTSLLN